MRDSDEQILNISSRQKCQELKRIQGKLKSFGPPSYFSEVSICVYGCVFLLHERGHTRYTIPTDFSSATTYFQHLSPSIHKNKPKNMYCFLMIPFREVQSPLVIGISSFQYFAVSQLAVSVCITCAGLHYLWAKPAAELLGQGRLQ